MCNLRANFLRQQPLFEGLTDAQFKRLEPLISEHNFAPGQHLLREHELSSDIFIIAEGVVEVSRHSDYGQALGLGQLGQGAVIGGLAVLENSPRSASVRAIQPTRAFSLSMAALEQRRHACPLPDTETEMVDAATQLHLISHLARDASRLVRNSNDMVMNGLKRELSHLKLRMAMGSLIAGVLFIICLYVLTLEVIQRLGAEFVSFSVVSVPVIGISSLAVAWFIARCGYAPSNFGLSLRGWKRACSEGLLYSLPWLGLVTFFKLAMIEHSSAYADRSLFEFTGPATQYQDLPARATLLVVLYLLFAPLQEMLIRGALQTSLQKFLVGRYRIVLAIVLSNLVFSLTHFHISLGIGLAVFLPGLFWGWLYARHSTLLGCVVSHQLIGAWALYVVGFF